MPHIYLFPIPATRFSHRDTQQIKFIYSQSFIPFRALLNSFLSDRIAISCDFSVFRECSSSRLRMCQCCNGWNRILVIRPPVAPFRYSTWILLDGKACYKRELTVFDYSIFEIHPYSLTLSHSARSLALEPLLIDLRRRGQW
jgi:hypothetical protein